MSEQELYKNLRYITTDHYVSTTHRYEPRLVIIQHEPNIPTIDITNALIQTLWDWGEPIYGAPANITPYTPNPGDMIPNTFKRLSTTTVEFRSKGPNKYPKVYNMEIGGDKSHRVFNTKTTINGVDIEKGERYDAEAAERNKKQGVANLVYGQIQM